VISGERERERETVKMVSNERGSEMVIVYGFSGGIDILNIKCTGPIKNRWQMEAAVRMSKNAAGLTLVFILKVFAVSM